MKRRLKGNKKKGFTLVELIVVLVILAILAALLIPALTGYIDKAKKKQIVAETRQCVMAAQTYAEERYGVDDPDFDSNKNIKVDGVSKNIKDAIKDLADVDGTVTGVKVTGGKVVMLKYESKDKKMKCEYNPNWTNNQASDGKYNVTE